MDAVMLGVAGLIAVAAITPGPNNLVVMRAAAQAGFTGALPAIAGIVGGGLAMLALAMAGIGALFANEPRLHLAVVVAGSAYLCWLGARLVIGTFAPVREAAAATVLPTGAKSLFAFQFVNPKGWVMVLTVTAAASGTGGAHAGWWLAVLFAAIPALCLSLWSLLGAAMTDAMERTPVRNRLDRVLGLVLVASAFLLLFVPRDLPS